MSIDLAKIRRALATLDSSASHTASGENAPRVDEIFAPEHHAGALDPNVTIVLGARGAGKSFWAGVLGHDETRHAASIAYPNLGLNKLTVRFGFTGLANDGSVSRATIDALVPRGEESNSGGLLWRCVVLGALQNVASPRKAPPPTTAALMKKYSNPESWERACEAADKALNAEERKVLIIFDALDALALEWGRLRALLDELLEVAWSTRGYRSLRIKLFLRPDQVRDLGLRFVELPKLLAGATSLRWNIVDLYGMLFVRLATNLSEGSQAEMEKLLDLEGIALPPENLNLLRSWPLARDAEAQSSVFVRMAGMFMGKSSKKGRTYDWPPKHLADGHGEVTPRSFLTLMIEAAKYRPEPVDQVVSAEGIRHGLREASKVRVNQLEVEFPWIKRVLIPLARLQVPANPDVIKARWRETETVQSVIESAVSRGFLPPFDLSGKGDQDNRLIGTLIRIGVMSTRDDERIDMPDLFRVAARLLKKGGVAPSQS